jgi:hypothetical protein
MPFLQINPESFIEVTNNQKNFRSVLLDIVAHAPEELAKRCGEDP